MMRDLNIKPSSQLKVPARHLMNLLRTIYGLSNSGDHWYHTFPDKLENDVKMSSTMSDIYVFFRRADGLLKWIMASYINDILW